jgi:hypothetical protein
MPIVFMPGGRLVLTSLVSRGWVGRCTGDRTLPPPGLDTEGPATAAAC